MDSLIAANFFTLVARLSLLLNTDDFVVGLVSFGFSCPVSTGGTFLRNGRVRLTVGVDSSSKLARSGVDVQEEGFLKVTVVVISESFSFLSKLVLEDQLLRLAGVPKLLSAGEDDVKSSLRKGSGSFRLPPCSL